jgi:hypothetical protein
MNHLKTIKRFVAGSSKYFDIYECTVDEVDTYTSITGKAMTRIVVNGKEYSGLYSKWVYEHLCANEGQPSFIVLWKAPKGDPMLAYVKEIWQNHIDGTPQEIVYLADNSEAHQPDGNSFVYMWVNKDTDKKYIGKHRGKPDDGYISSSESFMKEYEESPTRFIRTILAYGSDQEMLELETILLLQLKTRMSPLYYNLSDNLSRGN